MRDPEETPDPQKLIESQMAHMRLIIFDAVSAIDPEETYGGSDRVAGVIGAKMITDLIGAYDKLTPKKTPLSAPSMMPASFPRIPKKTMRALGDLRDP